MSLHFEADGNHLVPVYVNVGDGSFLQIRIQLNQLVQLCVSSEQVRCAVVGV